MSDTQYLENLKNSAMQMGIVALCMEDFATQIMWHVRNGGTLDEASLSKIKNKCVINLKNSEASGVPIEKEAEAFNKAIIHLETLMDGAIAKGKNLDY